jgi:RNA polymerase sigma-70 factor (ECF subfamily)
VLAAQEGDQAAFAALYERHRPHCVALGIRLLRDPAEAEEMVQVAFTKAYVSLSQLKDPARLGFWLRRIVSNCCLMRMRERERRRTMLRDNLSAHHGDAMPAPSDPQNMHFLDPERLFMDRQSREAVRTEIRKLPRLLRQALTILVYDDARVEDVAWQLGISLPAAKSRLQRARAELRSRLIASRRIDPMWLNAIGEP